MNKKKQSRKLPNAEATTAQQPQLCRFICPECHVALKAKPAKAGTLTHCPKCNCQIVVPINLVEEKLIYNKTRNEPGCLLEAEFEETNSSEKNLDLPENKDDVKTRLWIFLQSRYGGYFGLAAILTVAIVSFFIFGNKTESPSSIESELYSILKEALRSPDISSNEDLKKEQLKKTRELQKLAVQEYFKERNGRFYRKLRNGYQLLKSKELMAARVNVGPSKLRFGTDSEDDKLYLNAGSVGYIWYMTVIQIIDDSTVLARLGSDTGYGKRMEYFKISRWRWCYIRKRHFHIWNHKLFICFGSKQKSVCR